MDSKIIQITDFNVVLGMSQAEFTTPDLNLTAADITGSLTVNPVWGEYYYRLDNVRWVSIQKTCDPVTGTYTQEVICWFSMVKDVTLFHTRRNKIDSLLCL